MSRFESNSNWSAVQPIDRPRGARYWLFGVLFVTALICLLTLPSGTNAIASDSQDDYPCPAELTPGQNLIPVPIMGSANGRLRGTMILGSEQDWMAFRIPVGAPSDGSRSQCQPQYVRTFRELGAVPKMAAAPSGPFSKGKYALPRPGPTFRARVGDLIQLTFLNQINVGDFGDSIDRGETGVGGGCDETTAGYPGNPANPGTVTPPPPKRGSDKFPDCFHGSSTGNIHFHGTHTNPNTTGDNVFLEIRPSLRDEKGQPVVTPESVEKEFAEFFKACEANLSASGLPQWPNTWSDLPAGWTETQEKLLKQYDFELERDYGSGVKKLWPIDERQMKEGAWPQYYIGSYPYCFRLPDYDAASKTAHSGPMDMKMDMGETDHMQMADDTKPLIMGQSPGTHWYHAHKHGSTAINVANGITGAFIIEGKYDDDLNKFYGKEWTRKAQVLVVNQLGVSPNLMRGPAGRQDKGPDFSVNGQLRPVIEMRPNEVQMWRIVNTSGRAGVYFNAPPAGAEWRQIAQDGVQFNDANYQNHHNNLFLLAAGNRADLLLKAPAKAGSYNVFVQNQVDPSDLTTAEKITLVTIKVSGTPVDPGSNGAKFIGTAPTFPTFLADIKTSEVEGTKTIVFATLPGQGGGPGNAPNHTIGGRKFDGEIGEVVLLNKVEEWKVVNDTVNISHPFHIHINPFQVVENFEPREVITDKATGKQIDKYVIAPADKVSDQQCVLDIKDSETWRDCHAGENVNGVWWDVFPIPSARSVKVGDTTVQIPGYFRMRSRFVDYTGQYVIHCHILAHEDRGMMNIVEVVPRRTAYSHH